MATVKVHDKEFETFIKAEDIQRRVAEMASIINIEYNNKRPLFIGVLNGALIFMADLVKHISVECELAFIKVSSYSGLESTGSVKNLIGLNESIKDRHIIIIEDIIDTGDTAVYIINELKKQEPASLKFATILFKPAALKHNIKPDYAGFEIPTDFVVGYGLDYDGLGRNLNDIYKLKA
ncbi:MAG: hypoxanthine phosphoribosyltransferase [Bacteroidota bacterium]